MEEPKNLSLWSGYVLIINNIIGAGVLSIPWSYSQGGILLGLLSQVLASFVSLVLSYLVLQTLSRVHLIKGFLRDGYQISPVPIQKLFEKTHPNDFISHISEDFSEKIQEMPLVISDELYDLTEIIVLILGKAHGIIFNIILSFGFFTNLMAYFSIFSSSLASTVPILTSSTCDIYDDPEYFGDSCWRKYWFYLFILLSITSVLTLLKLKEQIMFQGTLAVMRFAVILLILTTCIVSLGQNRNLDDSDENRGKTTLINANAIGITFPVIVLANSFHVFIPNAVQWMEGKHLNAPLVIKYAIVTVSVAFTLMGVIVPMAVYNVEQMVTLEWVDYSGGEEDVEWWAYVIGYTIILFPAFDMLSILPLVSINFSDNFMSIIGIQYSEDNFVDKKVMLTRLAVVFVPAAFSVFFFEIGYINNVSGLFAILSAGVYIPVVSLASKRIVTQTGEYDSWFHSDWFSWFVMFVEATLFLICSIFLIMWIA